MSAGWATVLGAAVTGVLAWLAQVWAKRGTPAEAAHTLTGTAMGMLTATVARVERLEKIDDWRSEVKVIDDDHRDVLEAHIWRREPPPPPSRPIYPARPA